MGQTNSLIRVLRIADQSKWTVLDFVASDKGVLCVAYNEYNTIKAIPISDVLIIK